MIETEQWRETAAGVAEAVAAPAGPVEPVDAFDELFGDLGRDKLEADRKKFDAKLSGPWKAAVVIIGLLFLAVAITGMIFAFHSVSTELAKAPSIGPKWSWIVPLIADIGIFGFAGIDIVLERINAPFPPARGMLYALTVATTAMNLAAASLDLKQEWMLRAGAIVAHVTAPAVWVVFVETARHAVRRSVLAQTGSLREPIPFARWLVAPYPTLRLWRRMVMWNENNYRRALRRDLHRLESVGVARRMLGWRWRRALRPDLRLRLTLGLLRAELVRTAIREQWAEEAEELALRPARPGRFGRTVPAAPADAIEARAERAAAAPAARIEVDSDLPAESENLPAAPENLPAALPVPAQPAAAPAAPGPFAQVTGFSADLSLGRLGELVVQALAAENAPARTADLAALLGVDEQALTAAIIMLGGWEQAYARAHALRQAAESTSTLDEGSSSIPAQATALLGVESTSIEPGDPDSVDLDSAGSTSTFGGESTSTFGADRGRSGTPTPVGSTSIFQSGALALHLDPAQESTSIPAQSRGRSGAEVEGDQSLGLTSIIGRDLRGSTSTRTVGSTSTGTVVDLDSRRGSTSTRAAGSTSTLRFESTSTQGGESTSIELGDLDSVDLDSAGSTSTQGPSGSRPKGTADPHPAAGTGRRRTPKEGEAGWQELLERARQVPLWRGKRSAEKIRTTLQIAPPTAARLKALIEAEDEAGA